MAAQPETPNPKRRPFQYSLRALLLFVTVCGVVCALLATWREAQNERARENLIPIRSQADWPKEIRDFVNDARRRNVELNEIKVHYVVRDYWEYCWQTEYSPEVLRLMTSRWRLSPVGREHGCVPNFLRVIVEPRNLVAQIADADFLGSPNLVAREKGDYYLVICHKSEGLLIVIYYFNF